MSTDAIHVVERFWELMASNDFRSVGAVLADDAAVNEEYPAHGRWRFTVNRIVGNDTKVATDVSVTDGVQQARVISFFTVKYGKIVRQEEFWPQNYPAPLNRHHLVE